MKTKLFATTLLSVISIISFCQDFPKVFGNISIDELTMKGYDSDPEAEAVILFDIGDSRFIELSDGFKPEMTRTIRIKILNEAGLRYSNVSVPVYTGNEDIETISEVHGITYNFQNEKIEKTLLDESEVFENTINAYWSEIKFAMPSVKVGSVIEYTYKITGKSQHYLHDWFFQSSIPTIYSEYIARIIPFYTYTFILQGTKEFDHRESYEDKSFKRQYGMGTFYDIVHVMRMEDVPAFKNEEFITSAKDYMIKIDFQLSSFTNLREAVTNYMTSWKDMSKRYDKSDSFGKYIEKSEKLAGTVLPDDLDLSEDKNSLAYKIAGLIKENYSWNGIYCFSTDKDVKELLANKTGDVAMLNLFMVGALRSVGLEAYPVVLSTRNHGKIPVDYPFTTFFNYVIAAVKIGDSYILLDATDPNCSNKRIPIRCINEKGLLFDPDMLSWIPLDYVQTSAVRHNLIYNFLNDKEVCNVKITADEYEAINMRDRFGDDCQKLSEYMKDRYINTDVQSVEIKMHTDLEKPYSYVFTINSPSEKIGDKLIISPFQKEAPYTNPLKQLTRNYPVDFIYPLQKSYSVIINVPEGYKTGHVPEDLEIDNQLVNITYKTVQLQDILKVEFNYTTKKSMYPPEEYQELKGYFDRISEKAVDNIILVKE